VSYQNVSSTEFFRAALKDDAASQGACDWPAGFRVFKRLFDVFFAVSALPIMAVVSVVLLALNPFFNPGPVFFRQDRMGQGGVPFRVWKFRTMTECDLSDRGHDDGVEVHRITSLGQVLRRTRLDELPNFINVLRGEMSVIGPRPDMIDHAIAYARTVPRYGDRFRVKPGITGLAQIRHGYVESVDGVLRKARNDHIYIERASVGMELMIVVQTIRVMINGFGAR
jgi:lipopolysaccharide/colanic/teichoic acid biosynthesis glycosyltransferase